MDSTGVESWWEAGLSAYSHLEDEDEQVHPAHFFEGAHMFEWRFEAAVAKCSPGFKALFGIPEDEPLTSEAVMSRVHPEDAERVRAGQAAATQRSEPFEDEFRIKLPDGSIRWILARGRPILSASGEIVGLAGVNLDITERKLAEIRLARRENELRDRELMFRTLADAMPQMVWSARPDGHHDYFNARWYEFTGVRPGSTDGEGWNEIFHPDDRMRARELWHQALETGDRYEIEYRLRHHTGEYRWTLGRALPIRNAEGKILRWFGTCTDIHDAKTQSETNLMLGHELKHRIKNIFSVLPSLVGLTARQHPEAKAYAGELQAKIAALGKTHSLIHFGSEETDISGHIGLKQLLIEILSPYRSAEDDRILVNGDDVSVAPEAVTPLTLVFHELATNASKYGSLSTPEGRLTVTIERCGDEMCVTWLENKGPTVSDTPSHTGFGSKLSALAIEGQLKGRISRRWLLQGLEFTMTCPRWTASPYPSVPELADRRC